MIVLKSTVSSGLQKAVKENEQIHTHALTLHQNLSSTDTPEASEVMSGRETTAACMTPLQKDNPSHLKPTPKRVLTSFTPFVSTSSVFCHPLLQEFQDLAGFTEPIQCNTLFYFCWEFGEACMKSSFENMLEPGCGQVWRRHACI